MRILRDPKHVGQCVVVLGMFDGVHRGHQSLLMKGREIADQQGVPLCVCTFEPHPLRTVRPELAPPMLTTLPERASLFASHGVDILSVISFNKRRAAQQPEDFLAELGKRYDPVAVICGFNFSYGDKGRGNSEMLKDWCAGRGTQAVILSDFRVDGQTVSSTRIRGMLTDGDVNGAARLLGHYYTVSGPVVHGRRIGRTLGYPTANVQPPQDKALPAHGLYVCAMDVGDEEYPAMVDIGCHPTLPDGRITVEAHIPGNVRMDLYGQKVRLRFIRMLRGEQRFESRGALTAQLDRDAQDVLAYFRSLAADEEEDPWAS